MYSLFSFFLDARITKRTIILTLFPIYLNAMVWAISPLFGWGRYGPEPFGMTCTVDWNIVPVSYVVFIFAFCYFVPILLMILCYGCIIHSVAKAQQNMQVVHHRMDIYLTKVIKLAQVLKSFWLRICIYKTKYTPALIIVTAWTCILFVHVTWFTFLYYAFYYLGTCSKLTFFISCHFLLIFRCHVSCAVASCWRGHHTLWSLSCLSATLLKTSHCHSS